MPRTQHATSPALGRARPGMALLVAASLLTACVPASPTSPNAATPSAGKPTTSATGSTRLFPGAYYLRSVDGQALPVMVADGMRLESGFLVADSAESQLVGWGESVGRDNTGSVRLATGTARVLAEDHRNTRIANITWRTASAAADSVSWSPDSVIVHRTGAGLSLAGAGHRFIYTRATAADML